MYSAYDCQIANSSDAFTGRLGTSNCRIGAPGQPYEGCQIGVDEESAQGDGFNKGKLVK
jgi:hypothetical protein